MDILEFAHEKETQMEQTYRQLADNAPSEGLKNIFTRLANAEHRHADVVESMQEQTGVPLETTSLDEARSMFDKIQKDRRQLLEEAVEQKDVYKRARQLEEESRALYTEQSEKAEQPLHRNIFNQLAQQEKMHYIIMDNILDFIEKPEQWTEDAEFTHVLEKYAGTAYYPEFPELE